MNRVSRIFPIVVVLTGMTLFCARPFLAQTRVPEVPFDSANNFLKMPDHIYMGEAAGVATNSAGHVFVYTRTGAPMVNLGAARAIVNGASRLFEFDQNGKYVREIGQGLYAFAFAQAVRVDPQDNIWIVDQGANMVVKFDPDGRVAMTFGRKPEAITIPAATAAGAAAAAPAGPGGAGAGRGAGAGAPAGLGGGPGASQAGGQAGQGAAPGGGRGQGAPAGAAPAAGAPPRGGGGRGGGVQGDSFNRPTDVAWDAQGNIFIADGIGNSRVVKLDKNGKFVKAWGTRGTEPGQFDTLQTIATDAKGNVYIADKKNKRIQVFDNDGNPKAQYSNIGTPWAICISSGAHQYIYSSNSNEPDNRDNGEIYKLELDGTVLGKFGVAGSQLKEFGTANAIDCRNENVLYVGELINWRVQKLTLRPSPAR